MGLCKRPPRGRKDSMRRKTKGKASTNLCGAPRDSRLIAAFSGGDWEEDCLALRRSLNCLSTEPGAAGDVLGLHIHLLFGLHAANSVISVLGLMSVSQHAMYFVMVEDFEDVKNRICRCQCCGSWGFITTVAEIDTDITICNQNLPGAP